MLKRIMLAILIAFIPIAVNAKQLDNNLGSAVNSDLNIYNLSQSHINFLANGENDDEKVDLFDSNCADFAPTVKVFGVMLLLVKIVLPIIIIIRTSLDLLSVVTKGEPEELKKKVNKLLMSLLAAILIFFVPTIVNVIFDIVTNIRGVDRTTEDIGICNTCLFSPLSNECTIAVEKITKPNKQDSRPKEITCEYVYNKKKANIYVTFDVNYSTEEAPTKEIIKYSAPSNRVVEFGTFNLENINFINDKGNAVCPPIYVTYEVDLDRVLLHVIKVDSSISGYSTVYGHEKSGT